MNEGWYFAPHYGIWMHDELSAALLVSAQQRAGVRASLSSCITTRGQEYGIMVPVSESHFQQGLDVLEQSLAGVLSRGVTEWEVMPHLRRSDGSGWHCSCGERFSFPASFGSGSDNGRAAHATAHTSHTMTKVQEPGDTMAWYGISAHGAVAPSLILSAAVAAPVVRCRRVQQHAPDCECATL